MIIIYALVFFSQQWVSKGVGQQEAAEIDLHDWPISTQPIHCRRLSLFKEGKGHCSWYIPTWKVGELSILGPEREKYRQYELRRFNQTWVIYLRASRQTDRFTVWDLDVAKYNSSPGFPSFTPFRGIKHNCQTVRTSLVIVLRSPLLTLSRENG